MANTMPGAKRQSGFSLVELVVVVVIILIVAAIAVPNILRTVRDYRLNNAGVEVSNLIQQARYQAVRLNRDVTARATCPGVFPVIAWIDLNNNGALDAAPLDLNGDGAPETSEASVTLPNEIVFAPAGAPGVASMGAAFAGAIAPNCGGGAGAGITFNSRGVLDFVAGGAPVFSIPLGYDNQPQWGFRAVTVTPMGKTKLWKGTQGGAWVDR